MGRWSGCLDALPSTAHDLSVLYTAYLRTGTHSMLYQKMQKWEKKIAAKELRKASGQNFMSAPACIVRYVRTVYSVHGKKYRQRKKEVFALYFPSFLFLHPTSYFLTLKRAKYLAATHTSYTYRYTSISIFLRKNYQSTLSCTAELTPNLSSVQSQRFFQSWSITEATLPPSSIRQ